MSILNHEYDKDGCIINDVIIKDELTPSEEIEILKEILIDGYSSIEWKYLLVHTKKIFEKYNNNIDRIKNLEKEISNKDGEIAFLKAYLEKDETEWIFINDLAKRVNKVKNEPNEFGFPLNFIEKNARHVHTSDKNPKWCQFDYFYNGDPPDGKYKMYDIPWDLYFILRDSKAIISKIKKNGKPAKKALSLITIKNENDFHKHLEQYEISPDSIKELEKVYEFLDENRERIFPRKRFGKYCGVSPNTVSTYLNYLIKCNLILKLTDIKKYKVNIKEK